MEKEMTRRLASILSVSLCLAVVAAAQTGEQSIDSVDDAKTNHVSISIHRGADCGRPVLNLNTLLSIATGETITMCIKPSFQAYIYIVNESEEGTFMAYPESARQLGSQGSARSYTFNLMGRPGAETLTLFVSREPVRHFDELIRRRHLRMSPGQLYHGNGAESWPLENELSGDASGRSSVGFIRLVDSRFLEDLSSDTRTESASSSGFGGESERLRFDTDLSGVVTETPTPASNGPIDVPNGRALVLQFAYEHCRPH